MSKKSTTKFETNLVRLCLGGKKIGNGGQEMETEVQVPDGGAENDHRQEVNHNGRIVVVHRLAPKKGQNCVDTVGGGGAADGKN
jgi:hypothetical protein